MGHKKTGLGAFLQDEIEISVKGKQLKASRKGWRTTLDCSPTDNGGLPRYLGGKIPYFYREPDKIAADFAACHDALNAVYDLAVKAPTTEKFQQSHCGEILAAVFLEEMLGFRRLYSKLTLTTSENTNVHKMDGFFVDTNTTPFTFAAVEAKTSIQPTQKSQFRGHRHGILKSMIKSLNAYNSADKRFDFVLIRDNLSPALFTEEERKKIKIALRPPGPAQLINIGIATVNNSTVVPEDDDYILSEACNLDFVFRSIAVVDLATLSKNAYSHVAKLKSIV